MIDISGDVIYYDGKPVAIITVPNGSLRGWFEEELELVGDDSIEKELEEESEARDELEDRIDEALRYIDESENVSVSKIIEILS